MEDRTSPQHQEKQDQQNVPLIENLAENPKDWGLDEVDEFLNESAAMGEPEAVGASDMPTSDPAEGSIASSSLANPLSGQAEIPQSKDAADVIFGIIPP